MVPWGVWDEGSLPSSVAGLQFRVVLVQGDLGVGAIPGKRLHHLGESQHVGVVANIADRSGEETVLAATGDEGTLLYPRFFQKKLGRLWGGMALQQ